MVNLKRLHSIIDNMKGRKILVIGDVMLDIYESCVVKRISPEAPVPVAEVLNVKHFLGGAANVANNTSSLGCSVSCVSVMGNDSTAKELKSLLKKSRINCNGIIHETKRVTTVKKRILSGSQQMLRIDKEDKKTISIDSEKRVLTLLKKEINDCDVIIVSDYCKGVLTKKLVQFVKSEATKRDKMVFVDSKDTNLIKYSGVFLIKPNKTELELFSKKNLTENYSNLKGILRTASSKLKTNIVVTLGKDGMAFLSRNNVKRIRTETLNVFDVSGAGDTVLAVLAATIASGANFEEAIHLSNLAAKDVISKIGTQVCDSKNLHKLLDQQ